MHKTLLSVMVVLALLVSLCGCNSEEVGQFSYSKYLQEYGIMGDSDYFPSQVQPVGSAKEACRTALEVWLPIYGSDVLFQCPYQVSYDKNAGVWFVIGSLPPNTDGGTAIILIEAATGKILDCWHGK